MPYLNWITDAELEAAVAKLIDAARQAKITSQKKFHRNVIDPFAAMFQMAGFDLNTNDWIESELARQAGKTLGNHIGEFHQSILGSVNNWENLGVGEIVDLRSHPNSIIAEVKNKHNTVTGSKLKDVYEQLESLVMPIGQQYHGYTAYFVNIIPKRKLRYDMPFTPSDNTVRRPKASNPLIRVIDGASFYALVTGRKNALNELYEALPKVINRLSGNDKIDKQAVVLLQGYFERAFA